MTAASDARRDAAEYARAKVFYGEGAGTRRKLIQTTVEHRAHHDPAYARAFHAALARQDMAKHAKKARLERERIDRNAALARNVKGLLTGNSRALNTSVLVVGATVYLAHQTGLDKKIINKTKQVTAEARRRYHDRRRRKQVFKVYDQAGNN